MWERHHVTVEEATEALEDPEALVFNPDPKSRSGDSARVVGYSPIAQAVLVIILVTRGGDTWWGANGWRANARDQRIYQEEMGR